MPTGYLALFYWTIVALGAALFLGTGAALVRYRRTGTFPGAEDRDAGYEPTGKETRRVALRCVVGLLLLAVGAGGLVAMFSRLG
jgi:hypothetical protein